MLLKTTKPSHREGFKYIGAAGFEPTTPTTPKWYATKLRYAPFSQVNIITLFCTNRAKTSFLMVRGQNLLCAKRYFYG